MSGRRSPLVLCLALVFAGRSVFAQDGPYQTAQDLKRLSIEELAEIDVDVARFDGRTWAISARGFNTNPANKLLALMDGRTLYSPLSSGTFWDVQEAVLADIDRIEVIRGPGGSTWGANARTLDCEAPRGDARRPRAGHE